MDFSVLVLLQLWMAKSQVDADDFESSGDESTLDDESEDSQLEDNSESGS